MSESSERYALRKAAKEEAAKTMAADAKAAERAKKKALAAAPSLGNEDFLSEAARIEKAINSPGYGEDEADDTEEV